MNETAPARARHAAPYTPEKDLHVLQRAVERLTERYADAVPADTVERYVFESYTTLSRTARVRTHLAATAEHFAADRLRALAASRDRRPHDRPAVLFLCEQNAGRSQLAAALMRQASGDAVEVRSAGSQPAGAVHPIAEHLLEERELDPGHAYPKPVTDDVIRASDYIVTIGDGRPGPRYPDKEYLDWDIADPGDDLDLATGRRVLDDLEARVADLWRRISAGS